MSLPLHQPTFSFQNFTRKRVNFRIIKIASLTSLVSFLLVIHKLTPSDTFYSIFTIKFSFTNTSLLKAAQSCDRQHIFNKTAYFQSKKIAPVLKFDTSSACNAHDIFHFWEIQFKRSVPIKFLSDSFFVTYKSCSCKFYKFQINWS